MITIRQKGNFKKLDSFFERMKEIARLGILDDYGKMGVDILSKNTPKDSGKTANSWEYHINRKEGSAILEWSNTNLKGTINIALLIQYGHGTRNGGYVQGIDYINPSLRPVFEKMIDELGKELEKV